MASGRKFKRYMRFCMMCKKIFYATSRLGRVCDKCRRDGK